MKAKGKQIGFVMIMIILPILISAEKIRLEKAVKKGLVQVKFISLGSYQGEVMKMEVKNISGTAVELTVAGGTKLDSQENSEQDLIITKSVDVKLNPKEKKTYKIYTMCCQAHNGSPRSDHTYTLAPDPDSSIIKLARFIEKNDFQNQTAQSAMWSLTDGNCLEGITGEDITMVNTIRGYMTQLTGKKVQPFYIEYEQAAGAAFTGRPLKMSGVLEYQTEGEAMIGFAIYNADGNEVKVAFKERYVGAGSHQFTFKFETTNLPKGKYYARLTIDGQRSKEMEFVL